MAAARLIISGLFSNTTVQLCIHPQDEQHPFKASKLLDSGHKRGANESYLYLKCCDMRPQCTFFSNNVH